MKRIALVALSLILFSLSLSFVSAQEISVEFTDPGFTPEESAIPSFISNIYLFAIGIGGILAVGAIIVGGVMYIAEGAVPQKKTEGKNIILGALWGLALVVGAFVILKTVNPRLVELDNPGGELQRAYIQGCSEMTELPECAKDDKGKYTETERGNDGECKCRMIFKPGTCPLGMKRPPLGNVETENLPAYLWTKESGQIGNVNATIPVDDLPPVADIEGCPANVKLLPGTTPYFITQMEDDAFVLDFSKQPEKIGQYPSGEDIVFPLPEGEWRGYVAPFYLKKNPRHAICVLYKIRGYLPGNPRVEVNFSVNQKDATKSALCTNFSDEAPNDGRVKIKSSSGWGTVGSCELGKTHCAPANLESKCAILKTNNHVEAMSRICTGESNEVPDIVSGSDYCEGNKKYPFSIGLFQVNIVSEAARIQRITGKNDCTGLFQDNRSGACKKGIVPCYRGGVYKCTMTGTPEQWANCRRLLSNPETNISLMCDIYKEGGLKRWGAARRCGVLE